MFYKSVAFGVGGWFAAAQYVKFSGLAEPKTKWTNGAIFITSIPIGTSAVLVAKYLGIPPKDALSFVTIGTAVALILDGLATVYTPFLYTFQLTTPIEGLSAIAFGAGWGLLAGYYVSQRGSYPF